jgi:hypothetical protein
MFQNKRANIAYIPTDENRLGQPESLLSHDSVPPTTHFSLGKSNPHFAKFGGRNDVVQKRPENKRAPKFKPHMPATPLLRAVSLLNSRLSRCICRKVFHSASDFSYKA